MLGLLLKLSLSLMLLDMLMDDEVVTLSTSIVIKPRPHVFWVVVTLYANVSFPENVMLVRLYANTNVGGTAETATTIPACVGDVIVTFEMVQFVPYSVTTRLSTTSGVVPGYPVIIALDMFVVIGLQPAGATNTYTVFTPDGHRPQFEVLVQFNTGDTRDVVYAGRG